MNHNRLPETGLLSFSVLCFILVVIISISATAHADEPEETLPVNISVDIHWEIDEGSNIRKGYFRMNAKSTLNLDRAGSGLDHKPKLTPLSLKYRGGTFTGSCHFEETLTQKDPQPPFCPSLLESYSGSRGFSYSPPEGYDSINLFLRRFDIAKSLIKGVSGVGAQQFLAQLQSQMDIPPSYYEFMAGGVSGKHTIPGEKRKIKNGQCYYEQAETQVFMSVIGLRFPIPEDGGPMEGKQTWRAKLDGPPRNFSIKLSQAGVGKEKPFRPESVATGGNATYSISWNFKEVSPDLKIRRLKEGQWVDITDETQTVVVGEQIRLEAFAIPGSDDVQRGQWSIPGKKVKQFEGKEISGGPLDLKEEDLRNPKITFYWWDKSSKSLSVTYMTTVQGKEMTAEARFDVKEPNIRVKTEIPSGDWMIVNTPGYDPESNSYTDYVNLLYDPKDKSKDFSIRFSHGPLPTQFPGETQYVQIVNFLFQENESEYSCKQGEDSGGIDTTYPYSKGHETTDRPGFAIMFDCKNTDERGICTEWDASAGEDYKFKYITKMYFEMFLMFKPDKPQSIFVPLRVVNWSWIADLHRKTFNDPWDWSSSSINAKEDRDAKKFPKWDHVSPDEVPLR